VDDKHVCPFT